ncbi:Glycosyltransferase, GT2 family [Loktanella atrilutea]|uniref:Glycosyltransferase, GT2 family n=1 Tax=Loktanella atrilutea TaxID=366533 RepID=A0A1M5F459_LOKAT|nr:glycosyltransferase [Loktanella atrilutea]SHF85941.1 Glycosyltransferase, GT2 family [Loktanella atrilutea]
MPDPHDTPPGTGARAPRAAIIIPHFNDVTRLTKCLAALAPQLPAGGVVEVVVVDNGSRERLDPARDVRPDVRFLTEPRRGAAAARNTGVGATTAPNLFFIDADCVPGPDWLRTALALCGSDGIIGGRVDLFDETPPPRSGAEAFETVFAFPQKTYITRKNFSVTANLLTTRVVFDDTGPFDGTMVEDSDWCQRAVARGWPIAYHPELAVAHPTRNDWAALRRKWRRTTAENYFAGGTGAAARVRWGFRALAVLASAPVHVPRVLRHPALAKGERISCVIVLLKLRVLRAYWMLRQALLGERPLNS